MLYCSHCQKDMGNNFKICPVCNPPQPAPPSPPQQQPNYNPNPPPQPNYNPQHQTGYKSMRTTTILAVILGLFVGLSGIGHMYVGKVGKGIGILIGVLVLGVIGAATVMLGIGVIFLIGAFILFIWQIFNARKLCREYNDYLSRNGQPPW